MQSTLRKHEFEWVNRQTSYMCNGCNEGGFGARYRFDHRDLHLHEACMNPKPSITHEFFGECSFKFFDHPQGKGKRGCDACGRFIKGYVYHCKEADLDLHPCCLKLTRVIKARDMEFRICEKPPSKCCYCEKKKVGSHGEGWSYVSAYEKYCIHMSCVAEILAENREKGYFGSANRDNSNLVVETRISADRQLTTSKGGKKSSMWWKIAEIVLNTIIAIFSGNPTPVLLLLLNL